METTQINIYEFLNHNGDPIEFVCDGHIDSMMFREKCFKDYYVKPMVVRHQWRKTRKTLERKPGKKFGKLCSKTVSCDSEEKGAIPVTVGLLH